MLFSIAVVPMPIFSDNSEMVISALSETASNINLSLFPTYSPLIPHLFPTFPEPFPNLFLFQSVVRMRRIEMGKIFLELLVG